MASYSRAGPNARTMGVASAVEKHGCSKWTSYDWLRKDKRVASRPADVTQGGEPAASQTASPTAGQTARFSVSRLTPPATGSDAAPKRALKFPT